MAKCYVTGLGPKAGNNRSHSLQAFLLVLYVLVLRMVQLNALNN